MNNRGKRAVQHGFSGLPEYRVWVVMIQRCHSPNNKDYKYYGGRGITVCDEWRQSFLRFYESLHARPSRAHSIERIDNNGNYEPGNVMWATREQQAHNLRTNHWIDWEGRPWVLAELARAYGMRPQDLSSRIRNGWRLEAALKTPVVKRRSA